MLQLDAAHLSVSEMHTLTHTHTEAQSCEPYGSASGRDCFVVRHISNWRTEGSIVLSLAQTTDALLVDMFARTQKQDLKNYAPRFLTCDAGGGHASDGVPAAAGESVRAGPERTVNAQPGNGRRDRQPRFTPAASAPGTATGMYTFLYPDSKLRTCILHELPAYCLHVAHHGSHIYWHSSVSHILCSTSRSFSAINSGFIAAAPLSAKVKNAQEPFGQYHNTKSLIRFCVRAAGAG